MLVPQKLSGSTSGRGILVAATTSVGTTIHTAPATADGIDEIMLWAGCIGTLNYLLTIEWGDGVSTVEDGWRQTIFGNGGLQSVCPGLRLEGALVVTAFADTGNVVSLFGSVNRYRRT